MLVSRVEHSKFKLKSWAGAAHQHTKDVAFPLTAPSCPAIDPEANNDRWTRPLADPGGHSSRALPQGPEAI